MAIAVEKAIQLDPRLTPEKIKNLGERIKDRRVFLGLTREQVAVEVPFSTGLIGKIEAGLRLPTPEELRMLAMALRCQDRLDILHGNAPFYMDAKYYINEEQEQKFREAKNAFCGSDVEEEKLSIEDSKIVAKRIKKERLAYKDSLVWVAMQIGISDTRLRSCEAGKVRFFKKEVEAISKLYKSLTLKRLYKGTSLEVA